MACMTNKMAANDQSLVQSVYAMTQVNVLIVDKLQIIIKIKDCHGKYIIIIINIRDDIPL